MDLILAIIAGAIGGIATWFFMGEAKWRRPRRGYFTNPTMPTVPRPNKRHPEPPPETEGEEG